MIFETIAYAVEDTEDPDIFIAKRIPSAMLSPIPERRNLPQNVLLLVIALALVALVALVAVMTWLGMTGKFAQGNIPTPFTTSIPTMF